jgi:hypothetical protein
MRTVLRLHLLVLLFTTLCVELSTSVLFALSKPGHPHQKQTLGRQPKLSVTQSAFGGDGRNRTAVQNTFLVASYNHNYGLTRTS